MYVIDLSKVTIIYFLSIVGIAGFFSMNSIALNRLSVEDSFYRLAFLPNAYSYVTTTWKRFLPMHT